jgi:hypothetical protein
MFSILYSLWVTLTHRYWLTSAKRRRIVRTGAQSRLYLSSQTHAAERYLRFSSGTNVIILPGERQGILIFDVIYRTSFLERLVNLKNFRCQTTQGCYSACMGRRSNVNNSVDILGKSGVSTL